MKPAGRVLGTLTGYGTYYSEVAGEAINLGPPVVRDVPGRSGLREHRSSGSGVAASREG